MIFFSSEYALYYILGIVMLPGIIFAIIASARVEKNFSKYSKVLGSKNLTGAQVARKILDSKGLYDIAVVCNSSKSLVDNYNTNTKVVTLSSKVFNSASIAAVGIAAHECGHAIQDAEEYGALKFRNTFGKTVAFSSKLMWPLLMIGIVFNFAVLGGFWSNLFLFSGLIIFGLSAIFSLVTLPVEFNASKRALTLLVQEQIVDEMEVLGSKKVLNAAALTYVAALVVSILELLRFLLFFLMSRD